MGETKYGRDASARESTRDLKTAKWISVVQHKPSHGVLDETFGPLDSKGKADAYTAELVKSFTDPGLLAHYNNKEYKEAVARRSQVLTLTLTRSGGCRTSRRGPRSPSAHPEGG